MSLLDLPPRPLHVALIVGTRPEAIKLAPVALALQARADAKVSIWCTGQHPAWAIQMLRYFRLVPERVLELPARSAELGALFSGMMSQLQAILQDERSDVIVVQGDTSSALAGALAAAYARIPLVHVEAGLRTENRQLPFPEEAHRRAIAHFASLHCAPTRRAAEALLAEGILPADILLSGNTVVDALRLIQSRAPGPDLRCAPGRKLLVLTCHRRENWGQPYKAICAAAGRLAERGDCEIAFVVHPNPELARVAHHMLGGDPAIHLTPPLGYPEFLQLLKQATLVLTDSGGVQEEAATLGTPLLVMRDNTERPEGVDAGVARLVGTCEEAIVTTVARLLDHPAEMAAMRISRPLFGDGHAGARIAGAIMERWSPYSGNPAQIRAAAAAIGSSSLA